MVTGDMCLRLTVMAGPVPAIRPPTVRAQMAGTGPAMTVRVRLQSPLSCSRWPDVSRSNEWTMPVKGEGGIELPIAPRNSRPVRALALPVLDGYSLAMTDAPRA